jgi:hypothetical protein
MEKRCVIFQCDVCVLTVMLLLQASTFAPEPLKRRTELRAWFLRKLLDDTAGKK